MELHELIRMTTLINRLAKRALFAEEQMVALEGQCAEWKRIADELKAERNAEREQHTAIKQALGVQAAKEAGKVLGMVEGEGLRGAAERVIKERDAQSALVAKQRHLLAAKQTEIGALEAERDDLRKIVEMVHADLGIQRGDHVGEAISELKKEASDATARQRMTEARALNYSLQADEARREIERLRAKLNAKTIEWPEWAKEGTRVRVRSTHSSITHAAQYCVGDEFVIEELDEDDWSANAGGRWALLGDLEPVAEHAQPAVAVQS